MIVILIQVMLVSCTTEEDVRQTPYSGTWKLESLTVLNEAGQNMTTNFRLTKLSGVTLTLDAAKTYYTEDQNVFRNNKVFRFLFFADPKFYTHDSTRAFGVWDVIESGDLLFEKGQGEILAHVLERTEKSITLRTYTDFDFTSNGFNYFRRLGRHAGRERASAASGQSSYNDGFQLGSAYGYMKGYKERYVELWNSVGFDPTDIEYAGDAINANALGFIESIDQDLSNAQPTFNLGFADAYSTAVDQGRTAAQNFFKTSDNVEDHRKNYSLVYKFTRIQ
jgi:hypothetical protein